MTKEEIQTLLDSSDIRFRRIAIDDIVMSFPEHAELFFSAFHQDNELTKQMADAARQWMPVLRDGYQMPNKSYNSSVRYTTFSSLALFYSSFIDEMHKDLATLDQAAAKRASELLWYHFPGLRDEIDDVITYPEQEEHRQLMVFVTGRCNLHCPYCFSKELDRASVSKSDMLRVLVWAQRMNVRSLLPCGGEPLLYENIDWLMHEVSQRGMKMYFATNLSVPLPDSMLDKDNCSIGQIHVHLTDDVFRNRQLKAVFLNNLRTCRKNDIDIILRGNIVVDAVDNRYDEWLETAQDYGINALNVAFTIPSHTGSNNFVPLDTIRRMRPHLQRILDRGKETGVRVSIAKPLPLCLFPEDMALDILRHDHNAAYCNVHEDGGMHNLSLTTDLRFSPCLGVDAPGIPFDDDMEWDTLRTAFGSAIAELQSRPLFERCNGCFLYHRRLCQGACLSYKQEARKGGGGCAE